MGCYHTIKEYGCLMALDGRTGDGEEGEERKKLLFTIKYIHSSLISIFYSFLSKLWKASGKGMVEGTRGVEQFGDIKMKGTEERNSCR
jgi:hypothetical protein